jgi:hypothetical protein
MDQTRYKISGTGLNKLPAELKQAFRPVTDYLSENQKVYHCVLEIYSLGQNSNLAGIILVDFQDSGEVLMHFITAGAKTGMFQWDFWGGESAKLREMERSFKKICDRNNWQLTEIK